MWVLSSRALANLRRLNEDNLLDHVDVYDMIEVDGPGGSVEIQPAATPRNTIPGSVLLPTTASEQLMAGQLNAQIDYVVRLKVDADVRQHDRLVARARDGSWELHLDVEGMLAPGTFHTQLRVLCSLVSMSTSTPLAAEFFSDDHFAESHFNDSHYG